jgi:mannosyltransferase
MSCTIENIRLQKPDIFYGRGERTRTFDLTVPNRARYQLRHTPIGETQPIIAHFIGFYQWIFRIRRSTIKVMFGKLKKLSEGNRSWGDRAFVPIIIGAAIIAMAISLTIGLGQSVWFDEAYSVLLARQSTDQLLYLTSLDAHPPLYYLVLQAWAAMFGFGDAALRSLSVLAMGGGVVMAGLLLRRMFGVRIAFMAIPFVVFAPMLLRYGFEIRAYALAGLIGIVATYVLVVALKAKRRNQWLLYTLYAILVAAGTLTLYYLVLLWLAHLVWLLWLARREKQSIWKAPWLVALAGSVLLFLPWLPIFIAQVNNSALSSVTQALTLDNLTSIISFMFVYQPSWQVGAFMSLLVVAVIVAMAVLLRRVFHAVDQKHRPYLVLLVLYIFIPIVALALLSLVRPLYLERYLSHVMIGGYMLVGVVIAMSALRSLSKKMILVGAGVLAVAVMGVVHLAEIGNYSFQRLQRPMVAQAAAEMADCTPDQTILAADPYVAIELLYYLPDCEIRFYSQSAELSGGYAALSNSPLHVADPEVELANSRSLIYVYYDEPQLVMPANLTAAGRMSYGKLHVAEFYAEGIQ